MNSIGGFFVELGLKADKNSFAQGHSLMGGLADAGKKVAASLGITTGSFIALAKTAGQVESAELKAARALGVSAQALDAWKVSANVAGINGGALVGTMTQLEAKMQKLKMGQFDAGLAKSLSMLNIGYTQFADMDATQRTRAVFDAAGNMEDQRKAAQLVSDVLGQAGREYYDYLKLSGKSLDSQLEQGRALTFTTEETKKNAMLFNAEAGAIFAAGKSISMLFGSELARAMTPAAEKIKTFLMGNRELIQSGIVNFTNRLAEGVNAIFGALQKIAPFVSGLIDHFGGLDKVIVKIGLGFVSWKISGLVGGIGNLLSSVNLLKLGLKGLTAGLGFTALFMLLDDLMVYFSGSGNSVFGYIMDHMDEIKKKLKLDGLGDSWKTLTENVKNLINAIKGNDKVIEFFTKVGDSLATFAGSAIKNAIDLLSDLAVICTDLFSKDWDKLKTDIKNFFSDWSTGLFNTWAPNSTATQAYNETRAKGGSWWDGWKAAFKASDEAFPMQDGIIRPDGSMARVAPDDWVFAVRNVSDLAAAFTPGRNYTTNNTNAPASYVINQSFTINGAGNISAAVRQQAYSGANDALLNAMNNSQRMLQLMPGTR